MVGEAREKTGAGRVKMTMTSRVIGHPEGDAELIIEAEVDRAGKIVRFGRGMIGAVSKQLISQFDTCIGELLKADECAAADNAD